MASSSPTTRIRPGAIMEGSRASDSHVQTYPVLSSLWKSTSRSTTTALLLTVLTSSSIGRARTSDCPELVQGYRANRSAALPPCDGRRQAAGTGQSNEALGTWAGAPRLRQARARAPAVLRVSPELRCEHGQ